MIGTASARATNRRGPDSHVRISFMLTSSILVALLLSTAAGESTPGPAVQGVATDPWPAQPRPPLYRMEPRGYTMGLGVSFFSGTVAFRPNGRTLVSDGGDLSIDVAHADPYSLANLDEIQSQVLFNSRPSPSRLTIVDDPAGISRRIVTAVPTGSMSTLTIRTSWPAIAFASRVDEAGAATVTWPREWPEDVRPFLEPSPFIESADPRFRDFVDEVSGGRLRRTSIYLAAKDLVRNAILQYRNVQGEVVVRSVPDDNSQGLELSLGTTRILGYHVRGASQSIGQLQLSPPDLVCTCVAVLRAAGIPARPVIGIDSGKGDQSGRKLPRDRTSFAVWAEFRLPGKGWIPFDPWQMRGQGLRQLKVQQPWRWFGTIRDLNRRVALAYDFAPSGCGTISPWPGGWAMAISWRSDGRAFPTGTIEPILISRGSIRP